MLPVRGKYFKINSRKGYKMESLSPSTEKIRSCSLSLFSFWKGQRSFQQMTVEEDSTGEGSTQNHQRRGCISGKGWLYLGRVNIGDGRTIEEPNQKAERRKSTQTPPQLIIDTKCKEEAEERETVP